MSRILHRRHPRKHELFAYAESLMDRRGPVSAKIGAHVAGCPACRAQVHAIRNTLRYVGSARPLDPPQQLIANILLAAQDVRNPVAKRDAFLFPVIKGVVYAAAVLLVTFVSFGTAIGNEFSAPKPETTAPVALDTSSQPSPEAIRKATAEIKSLVAAVSSTPTQSQSLIEQHHRRALRALTDDLAAAHKALARNPGCSRASHLVDRNLQRQAQALRTLYAERSL